MYVILWKMTISQRFPYNMQMHGYNPLGSFTQSLNHYLVSASTVVMGAAMLI